MRTSWGRSAACCALCRWPGLDTHAAAEGVEGLESLAW